MTTEDIAVEEDVQAAAPEENLEVEIDGEEQPVGEASTDEQPAGKVEDEYAAELERLRTERDNYKQGMLIAKDKLKGKPTIEEATAEALDEDVVDKKISSALAAVQQQIASSAITTTLASISSNDNERKLILHHYQNTVRHSGYEPDQILSDLRAAQVLANRNVIERTLSETRKSMHAKQTAGSSSMGSNLSTGVSTPIDNEIAKLNSQEKELMQRAAGKMGLTLSEYIKKSKNNFQ